MSGSTENRASGAPERSSHDTILTWFAANRMLPLVQRIVADVMQHQARLREIQPEKDRLDRRRHSLAWPERARRYQLEEEIAAGERHLREAVGELEGLGLTLIDLRTGQVGFPTMVNKRPAFFSWLPGEPALAHWHYADDAERHPIPAAWTKAEPRRKTKS